MKIEDDIHLNENSQDILDTGLVYGFQFPNLKWYVGQTKRTISQRFKEHVSEDSNCVYLKYAFRKYGMMKANVVILKRDIPLEHLDFYEDLFIKTLGSLYPNGYNAKLNGANCNPPEFEPIRLTPPIEPPKEIIKNPFDKFAIPGSNKPVKKEKEPKKCKQWLESFPMLCR